MTDIPALVARLREKADEIAKDTSDDPSWEHLRRDLSGFSRNEGDHGSGPLLLVRPAEKLSERAVWVWLAILAGKP